MCLGEDLSPDLLSQELIDLIDLYDGDNLGQIIDFLERKHSSKKNSILNTNAKKSGLTPLMAACKDYRPIDNESNRLVRYLVEVGSDVNVKDRAGDSDALIYALMPIAHEFDKKIRLERVTLLLENGADANTMGADWTALGLAVKCDKSMLRSDIQDMQIVRTLLARGARVDVRDRCGRTALMLAGTARLAGVLVKAGAHVDAQDVHGRTPLIYSVLDSTTSNDEPLNFYRFTVIFELIGRGGANVFVRDSQGKTAIDYLVVNELFNERENGIPAPGSNYTRLFLASKYLNGLYSYFKNSSYDKIKADMDEYLKNPLNPENDAYFPFQSCHLISMNIFAEMFEKANKSGRVLISNIFISDFYFLPYFSSVDFKEKLLADVLFRINVDNAEVDGQTLVGKKCRAKTECELQEIEELVGRLKLKTQIVYEFYVAFGKATRGICEHISRLLTRKPEAEYFTNPNKILQEYMDKFDRQQEEEFSRSLCFSLQIHA